MTTNNTSTPTIRLATVADAPVLREIYLPYVQTTAVTFELEDPTLEDFTSRVETTLGSYPYLVAEVDGVIVGYTYASPFRPRAAYRHAIETSIYVRMGYKGNGVGRRLYETLARMLMLQNVYNMEACIAHCDPPDEYVPSTSRLFHERLGFRMVGSFKQCAHKFGRWYDMIWMERIIADHPENPDPFKPFHEVNPELIDNVLKQANR
ncbi:MAG: N-acetyltransferase family protein [Eggerthellaceae bacterium]